jgi:hypothetical protein
MGTEVISNIKNQEVKKAQGMSNPFDKGVVPKRLFTLREASMYMGRTLWGMRELVWSGLIPVVRTGKKMFVDVKDLDGYIEKNKSTYI